MRSTRLLLLDLPPSGGAEKRAYRRLLKSPRSALIVDRKGALFFRRTSYLCNYVSEPGKLETLLVGAGAITPLGSWNTECDSRARLWLLLQPSRSSLSDIWEANQLWLDRSFCALSSGAHDDDVWSIDPRGVLTLCLCKETYETLGLVGKKLPFKGCPERYGSYSF